MAGRQMLPDSRRRKPSLYPSQAGWPMLAKLEYSYHIPKQPEAFRTHLRRGTAASRSFYGNCFLGLQISYINISVALGAFSLGY